MGLDGEPSFLAEKERWNLVSRDRGTSRGQRRKGGGLCCPELGKQPHG